MRGSDTTLFDQAKPDQQKPAALAEPVAHRADPLTSYQAGERFYRTKLKGQMRLVLMGVQRWPGTTSAELGKLVGIDRHAAARRLPGLQRRGLVKKGRERFCTVCRSTCVTWWPAEKTPLFHQGRKQ
jgi:hypothetical protein